MLNKCRRGDMNFDIISTNRYSTNYEMKLAWYMPAHFVESFHVASERYKTILAFKWASEEKCGFVAWHIWVIALPPLKTRTPYSWSPRIPHSEFWQCMPRHKNDAFTGYRSAYDNHFRLVMASRQMPYTIHYYFGLFRGEHFWHFIYKTCND